MTLKRGLIPNVYEVIRDYQIGQLGPGTDNVMLKIGVSSKGPINEPYSMTDPDDAVTVFGSGPLVESAAYHAVVSGAPQILVRANASAPGVVSDVTRNAQPNSLGQLAVEGEPNDAYDAIIKIQRAGPLGTAAFTYSLDGGDVYSGLRAVPLSGRFPIPNTGLTLVFSVGQGGNQVYLMADPVEPGFALGDEFTFTATAPAPTLSDINDAITAALNDPREWSLGHIIGGGSPVLFAALEVRGAEALNDRHRFVRFIMEVRDFNAALDNPTIPADANPAAVAELRRAAWQRALGLEYGNTAGLRVSPVAGQVELYSALTGNVMRRSLAWVYAARLAATDVHIHPGDVQQGPLIGVVSLSHDEDAHPGLDLLGFTTGRTLVGKKGFYLTEGRVMAPNGSDFTKIELCRVMDKACKISRAGALDFLNTNVVIDDEGKISEADAAQIKAYLDARLLAELVSTGNASDAFVVVRRDPNLAATRALGIRVCVRPKGYLSHITLDIGFFNPALVPTRV